MRVFRAAALLAGFLCAGQAISDLPAREPRSERNLIAPGLQRESVSLVLINVVVTDRTGRRVHELRPDEIIDETASPIRHDNIDEDQGDTFDRKSTPLNSSH